MKAIQVRAVVLKRKGLKARLFGDVEGDLYAYQASVTSVGDEGIGAEETDKDGRNTNLAALELAWQFPSGQLNVRRFPFPSKLGPGESHTFPRVEHNALSPGFALMFVRLWWVGTGLDLTVQDASGHVVPLSDTVSAPYVPEWGKRANTMVLERGFASSRFRSRGEVYQSITLLIAVIGLLLNAAVGIINLIRR